VVEKENEIINLFKTDISLIYEDIRFIQDYSKKYGYTMVQQNETMFWPLNQSNLTLSNNASSNGTSGNRILADQGGKINGDCRYLRVTLNTLLKIYM
jgi:hypothetical protein